MLILQRKAGQSLLIGDQIKITILDTGDGRVRLAVHAPKEIKILREELAEAAALNRAAAEEEASPLSLLGLIHERNAENGKK